MIFVAQIEERPERFGVESILKRSLVETVAAELRARLADGRMTGSLPGVRLLSRSLGVSVPTLCRALHQLQAEGALAGGKRQRWRVVDAGKERGPESNPPTRPKRAGRHSGRLLFLASHSLSSERHSGVEVFSELLDQLGTTAWEVMYRVENFWTAKRPHRSWDELLKLTKPDAVVALGGTPVLGEWLKQMGIRTMFIGGDPGDSGVPVVAVRVGTMIRYTLERLLAQKHQRILLPLCGRGRGLVSRCCEAAKETAAAANRKPDSIVIAETAYARPEVIVDLLRRQWRKQAPDALILLDWREFLAASGFFREAGIEIPRDLSVVILSQNPIMDWHLPKITHFEHPVKLMARTVSKWVTQGRPLNTSETVMEVRARWVEGKSVMTRK